LPSSHPPCIIYSGGTTAVLPLSLVQQTSMEITRTDPHGFSTTVHRGFTTDTAVLLWIHTDLVQRAAANLLRTRERRARRSTERIVQEENFGLDYRASEGPRGQVGVRGHHLPNGGRVLRGERSGTDRTGYCDRTGLLGPPTVAVRRTPSGGISHAAVLVSCL